MSDRFLDGWAERLAAAAAPDEIDIAPETAAAYVAGGAARWQLFAGTRGDPGAVLVAAVMPGLAGVLG